MWAAFVERGYSIRLVHPQQWHAPLFELCSCAQEFFGNVVTCSSYLTPANTQGFGPHYDDAEIFLVQASTIWLCLLMSSVTVSETPPSAIAS